MVWKIREEKKIVKMEYFVFLFGISLALLTVFAIDNVKPTVLANVKTTIISVRSCIDKFFESFKLKEPLKYSLIPTTIVWVLYSTKITITSILSAFYRPKKAKKHAKNVYFVVVTIASQKVKNSLEEVLNKLKKFKLKTYVVVNEGCELESWLKNRKDIELIIIPKSYTCNAKYKARAINYFIEYYVKPNDWYVFLDDDSYPLTDNFLYEIPYYDKKGFVGANCILVPREGRLPESYVLDHFRTLDDLTLFRTCQGLLRKPIVGFHGEGLILKGKVLKDITFNFESITEDFRFSQEFIKKKYKTWHSNTKVSILSPNSVKDFFKQRVRWAKGLMLDLKHCHPIYYLFFPIHLFSWIIAVFGSLPFFLLSLIYPVPQYILFPAGTIYWLIGSFVIPKERITVKLKAQLLGVIEVFASIYALLTLHKKEFVVIDKS